MPRISGDTLSLYNLAGATGNSLTNISLGTIKGSPAAGNNISMSNFSIDSVDSISGFTYAVENTNENYTLGFTTGSFGILFDSKIGNRSQNVTWSVPVGSRLSVNTNNGRIATIAVSSMTNNPTQTVLQSIVTHTVRAVFNDGFNDHATGYNTNKDKTVYSVDSYDGNSAALCLTIDFQLLWLMVQLLKRVI